LVEFVGAFLLDKSGVSSETSLNLSDVSSSSEDQFRSKNSSLKDLLVLWCSLSDLLLVDSDSSDVQSSNSSDDPSSSNSDSSLSDDSSSGNSSSDDSDLLGSVDSSADKDSSLEDESSSDDLWFLGLLDDSLVSSGSPDQSSDVSLSSLDDSDSENSLEELGLVLGALGSLDLSSDDSDLSSVLGDKSSSNDSSDSLSSSNLLTLEDSLASSDLSATLLLSEFEELLVGLLDEWCSKVSLNSGEDSKLIENELLKSLEWRELLGTLQSLDLLVDLSNDSGSVNLNLNLSVLNLSSELGLLGCLFNVFLGSLKSRELLGKDVLEVVAFLSVSSSWLLLDGILFSNDSAAPVSSDNGDLLGVSGDLLLKDGGWGSLELLFQDDESSIDSSDVFGTSSDQSVLDDLSSDDSSSSSSGLWRGDDSSVLEDLSSDSSSDGSSSSVPSSSDNSSSNELSSVLLSLSLSDSLDQFDQLSSLILDAVLDLFLEGLDLLIDLLDSLLLDDSLLGDDSLLDDLLDLSSLSVVDWSGSEFLDEDESLLVSDDLSSNDDDSLGDNLGSSDDSSVFSDSSDDLLLIFLSTLDDLCLNDLLSDDLSLWLWNLSNQDFPFDDLLSNSSNDCWSSLSGLDDWLLGLLLDSLNDSDDLWLGDSLLDPDNFSSDDVDSSDDDLSSLWLFLDDLSVSDDLLGVLSDDLLDEFLTTLVDLVLQDLLSDDLSLRLWNLLELLSELSDSLGDSLDNSSLDDFRGSNSSDWLLWNDLLASSDDNSSDDLSSDSSHGRLSDDFSNVDDSSSNDGDSSNDDLSLGWVLLDLLLQSIDLLFVLLDDLFDVFLTLLDDLLLDDLLNDLWSLVLWSLLELLSELSDLLDDLLDDLLLNLLLWCWSLLDDDLSAHLGSSSESRVRVPDLSSSSELSLESWSLVLLGSSVVLLFELGDVFVSTSAGQFKSEDLLINLLLLLVRSGLCLLGLKLENSHFHPSAVLLWDSLDGSLLDNLLDGLSCLLVFWSLSEFSDDDYSLSVSDDFSSNDDDSLGDLLGLSNDLSVSSDSSDDLLLVFLSSLDDLLLEDLSSDDLSLWLWHLLELLSVLSDLSVDLLDLWLSILLDDLSPDDSLGDNSSGLSVDWSSDEFLDPDDSSSNDGDSSDDDLSLLWLSSDDLSVSNDSSSVLLDSLSDDLLTTLDDLSLDDLLSDDLSLWLWNLLELFLEVLDDLLVLLLVDLWDNSLLDDLLSWLSVLWSELLEVFLASTSFGNLLLEGSSNGFDLIGFDVSLNNNLDELSILEFLGKDLGFWIFLKSFFEVFDNLGKGLEVLISVNDGSLFLVLSLLLWGSLGLWSLEVSLLELISLLQELLEDLVVMNALLESLSLWNLLPDLLGLSDLFPVDNSLGDLSALLSSGLLDALGFGGFLGCLVSQLGFLVLSDNKNILGGGLFDESSVSEEGFSCLFDVGGTSDDDSISDDSFVDSDSLGLADGLNNLLQGSDLVGNLSSQWLSADLSGLSLNDFLCWSSDDSLGGLSMGLSDNLSNLFVGLSDDDDSFSNDGDSSNDDLLLGWVLLDLFLQSIDLLFVLLDDLLDVFLTTLDDLLLDDLLLDDLLLGWSSLLELLFKLSDLLDDLLDDLLVWLSLDNLLDKWLSLNDSLLVLFASTLSLDLFLEILSQGLDGWGLEVFLDNLLDDLGTGKSVLEVSRGWLLSQSSLEISDDCFEGLHVSLSVKDSGVLLVLSFSLRSSSSLW